MADTSPSSISSSITCRGPFLYPWMFCHYQENHANRRRRAVFLSHVGIVCGFVSLFIARCPPLSILHMQNSPGPFSISAIHFIQSSRFRGFISEPTVSTGRLDRQTDKFRTPFSGKFPLVPLSDQAIWLFLTMLVRRCNQLWYLLSQSSRKTLGDLKCGYIMHGEPILIPPHKGRNMGPRKLISHTI